MLDRSDPFDARIDAVARQKSAGELRLDFRRRVVSRIAELDTTRPRKSRAMWHGSLAGVAIFAVVITYMRQSPAPVSSVAGRPSAPFRYEEPATTAATSPAPVTTIRRLRVPSGPATPPADEAFARFKVELIFVQPITELPIDVPQNPPPDALALTPLSISPLSPQGER